MVTLTYKVGKRKGQYQDKLSQIRPNFHIHNFHTKACLSCPVWSQDSKNVIYCFDENQESQKCVSKSAVITFNCFSFWQLHSKNKNPAMEFLMRIVLRSPNNV